MRFSLVPYTETTGELKKEPKKAAVPHKIAAELAKLTLLGGVKFKGFEAAKACNANDMRYKHSLNLILALFCPIILTIALVRTVKVHNGGTVHVRRSRAV
jgi:hypothetical protein